MCVYYSNFDNPVTRPVYSAVARIQTEVNGESPTSQEIVGTTESEVSAV
jgi:hypothetical protein